jgi:hypothetical protein
MSKIISTPQSGRVGPVVYINSRYGQIVKQFIPPRNPRTPDQQRNRSNFGAASGRWRALKPEQRIDWSLTTADSAAGRGVNCAHSQVSINSVDLGSPLRQAFLVARI